MEAEDVIIINVLVWDFSDLKGFWIEKVSGLKVYFQITKLT